MYNCLWRQCTIAIVIHNKIFGEDLTYVATSYWTQRGISVQQCGRLQPSQRTLRQSTDVI